MNARIMFICAWTVLIGAVPEPDSDRIARVFNLMEIEVPGEAEVTGADLWESGNMVCKVIRLAPGATIAEHHHPVFDEGLIVFSGKLTVSVNGKNQELHSGQIVYLPAGTVLSATNETDQEAIVIATWANIGREGPLTLPGKPKQE